MNPLTSVCQKNKWVQIRINKIMAAIQSIVRAAGPAIVFTPKDVSTWSLQAVGVMALLAAQVDPDKIRILGR